MSEEYKDKVWLETKYNIEKLSDPKIARLCKVSQPTIGNWRKNFNIVTRSRAEREHLAKANHCSLSTEAMEWINGELLGDGCIQSYSEYSAFISYTSKYFDYCKYVSATLKSFGINQMGKINEQYCKEMDCYTYQYNSLYYSELLPIRKKWYPQGKKIVPRDLKLTSLVCRQWFIGDGGLGPPTTTGISSIILCTCGFSILDVKWLIEQLTNKEFKTTRHPSSNVIHISVHSVKNFLNYIGPCPAKDYEYKWNYYTKKEIN